MGELFCYGPFNSPVLSAFSFLLCVSICHILPDLLWNRSQLIDINELRHLSLSLTLACALHISCQTGIFGLSPLAESCSFIHVKDAAHLVTSYTTSNVAVKCNHSCLWKSNIITSKIVFFYISKDNDQVFGKYVYKWVYYLSLSVYTTIQKCGVSEYFFLN